MIYVKNSNRKFYSKPQWNLLKTFCKVFFYTFGDWNKSKSPWRNSICQPQMALHQSFFFLNIISGILRMKLTTSSGFNHTVRWTLPTLVTPWRWESVRQSRKAESEPLFAVNHIKSSTNLMIPPFRDIGSTGWMAPGTPYQIAYSFRDKGRKNQNDTQ